MQLILKCSSNKMEVTYDKLNFESNIKNTISKGSAKMHLDTTENNN